MLQIEPKDQRLEKIAKEALETGKIRPAAYNHDISELFVYYRVRHAGKYLLRVTRIPLPI